MSLQSWLRRRILGIPYRESEAYQQSRDSGIGAAAGPRRHQAADGDDADE